MKEFMKAEDLAPVVSFLCHESFPENGSVVESFGGWVSKGKCNLSCVAWWAVFVHGCITGHF